MITGASRGIGKTIALGLAAEGCRLSLCARGREDLDETVSELRASGAEVLSSTLDVTDENAARRWFDETRDRYQTIDILVNNVGGSRPGGNLSASNDDWHRGHGGGTGHYEAVEITYDPAKVSYEALLTAFWHSVDPTDGGGQFCDRGQSYETAVFAANEKERGLAEASKKAAQKRVDKPIVTPILAAKPFYAAEDYHQDYYTNNPLRYRYYRFSCGRDSRVKEIWGKHAYEGIPDHG
ncbi:Peptide methionine sulfoxide reductase MsrA 2 [Geodia barretti]|uniref:peptide-methionine (S)-S-oxide reductase n=1 Tax=Geodia barretti TaxID=519541 RepID=A0AA35QRY2_GEOBA|nr:Peptide methionine sulfoxide reductase MsrA 2 [Geodia barretti]